MQKYGTLILLLLTCTLLKAQIPNYLLYDSEQTQQFGAENLITLHQLIYTGIDTKIPPKLWEEDTFLKKSGGIGYRTLKLLFFDFQIDFLFALTQHEAFGHGSRMRELNHEQTSYQLNMFFPFGKSGGFARGRLRPGHILTNTQSLALAFSGNEGNLVLSESLEARMLLNNQIHYRQGLLYLIARNNLLQYSSRTYIGDGDGDIKAYIERINAGRAEVYDAKKLFLQNLIVLVNPIQFYAVWTLSKTYLLDGKDTMTGLPFIEIKDIRYLPLLNFNLTPFGGEFILNQYFIKNNSLLMIQARLGDNTFHSFYGGGAKVMNIINSPKFKLNAELNFWYQPAFEIGETSIKTIEEGIGAMANCSFSIFPFSNARDFGIYGQLGYKTPGYILGEPLDKGLILRFGLAMNWRG